MTLDQYEAQQIEAVQEQRFRCRECGEYLGKRAVRARARGLCLVCYHGGRWEREMERPE
jgi:hypothetical protein